MWQYVTLRLRLDESALSFFEWTTALIAGPLRGGQQIMPIPQTTLEQWSVLRTVVESGSFARAAEQLNRSQSSVSYAMSRLQERLGVPLPIVPMRCISAVSA